MGQAFFPEARLPEGGGAGVSAGVGDGLSSVAGLGDGLGFLRFDLPLGVGLGEGLGEAFFCFGEGVGDGGGVVFFFLCLRLGVGDGSKPFLIFVPNDSSAAPAVGIAVKQIATNKRLRKIILVAANKINGRAFGEWLC